MNGNYYLYRKLDDTIEDLLKLMSTNNFSLMKCKGIVADTKRDFLNYKQLKSILSETHGLLFINKLRDIGFSKQDILEELLFFSQNQIELVILDMPSTWIFNNKEANLQNIHVLIDVFDHLINNNSYEVLHPENIDGGRKKIKFPNNWEVLYRLYSEKEISANDFQQKSGLKRATFYNLLSEYKEMIKSNKMEMSGLEDSLLNSIQIL